MILSVENEQMHMLIRAFAVHIMPEDTFLHGLAQFVDTLKWNKFNWMRTYVTGKLTHILFSFLFLLFLP